MSPLEANPAFIAELQRARSEGVYDDGNLPFIRAPQTASTGVLLVHGFTASPWEMRFVAERLHQAGLACLVVRLPGHGTSPEDLARRSWQEWLKAVEDGYRLLAQNYSEVYGVGMSTGCLLLLALALQHELAGAVLFSPYLRIRHRLAPYAGWLRHVLPFREAVIAPDDQAHYYARRPVAGIDQINRLIRALQPRLAQVTCPVLAINGLGDQTVDAASGRELVDRLGSALRVHQMLGPESPHLLVTPVNPHQEETLRLATEFIVVLESLSGNRREVAVEVGNPLPGHLG